MYEAAGQLRDAMLRYEREFEANGGEWSAPNLLLRMLLGSTPMTDLRHARHEYGKERGLE